MLDRLLREPPFRLAGKLLARRRSASLVEKVFWESCDRPHYAAGVLMAASEASKLRIKRIAVAEFGVSSGDGLLAMERIAARAAREFGVEICVFGFDLGSGLPKPRDFRDHPERWRKGQYRMDVSALRKRLRPETQLVLGDVAKTVPEFLLQRERLGFAAFDLDFYHSTRAALAVLYGQTLPHTPLYFDEILLPESHRWAGELLAIDEFNAESDAVKIDRWHGQTTAFPESPWREAMRTAHRIGPL